LYSLEKRSPKTDWLSEKSGLYFLAWIFPL